MGFHDDEAALKAIEKIMNDIPQVRLSRISRLLPLLSTCVARVHFLLCVCVW